MVFTHATSGCINLAKRQITIACKLFCNIPWNIAVNYDGCPFLVLISRYDRRNIKGKRSSVKRIIFARSWCGAVVKAQRLCADITDSNPATWPLPELVFCRPEVSFTTLCRLLEVSCQLSLFDAAEFIIKQLLFHRPQDLQALVNKWSFLDLYQTGDFSGSFSPKAIFSQQRSKLK